MKNVPDSVFDYVVATMEWKEKKNLVYLAYPVTSKKKLSKIISRASALFEKLESEYDALVIFRLNIVVYKDRKCGLYTLDGEELLPIMYEEIFVEDESSLAEVIGKEKVGIYSVNMRKFIVPLQDYEIAELYDICIIVKKANLCGALNLEGQVIIQCEWDNIWACGKNPNYITKKGNAFFCFNEVGKRITSDEYTSWDEAYRSLL